MSDLDYCPFCGSDDVALQTTNYDVSTAQVLCNHCCAMGGYFTDSNRQRVKDLATENWNQKCLRGKDEE